MQHRARMGIERNHGGHRAGLSRTFDNSLHDQLVAQVQTVKHAEREHGRALDVRVVSAVKKTHGKFLIVDFRLPIERTRNAVQINNHQSSIVNASTTNPSYANSTPAGNRAESRPCLMSCAMCVKNVRRGFITSMYSNARSTQRCVGCSRKRRQSSTSTSRPCNESMVSAGISLTSVRYAKSLKRYAITGSRP